MLVNFRNAYRLLSFLGVHPLHNLRRSVVCFNILVFLCMYCLVLIKLCMGINRESIEAFGELTHISIKYAVLIFKRDAIKQVVNDIERFWKHDFSDPQIYNLIQRLEMGGRLYNRYLTIGFLGFVLKPFILRGTSIFGCYIPPQIPYSMFYFLEFYVMLLLVTIYIAFNVLICSIIILVVVQFRLLNNKLKAVDFSSASENDHNLKICLNSLKIKVAHHNFLIEFTEKLNNILSLPIFLLYIICVSILCINTYVLTQSHMTKIDWIRNGLIGVGMTSEFFFIYGLPAQLLLDEAEKIGNTVYCECEWYLPNIVPVRKYLLMMLIRSQRPVRISAENFIDINNRTILLMLKTTYTFLTFFQTIT